MKGDFQAEPGVAFSAYSTRSEPTRQSCKLLEKCGSQAKQPILAFQQSSAETLEMWKTPMVVGPVIFPKKAKL